VYRLYRLLLTLLVMQLLQASGRVVAARAPGLPLPALSPPVMADIREALQELDAWLKVR